MLGTCYITCHIYIAMVCVGTAWASKSWYPKLPIVSKWFVVGPIGFQNLEVVVSQLQ